LVREQKVAVRLAGCLSVAKQTQEEIDGLYMSQTVKVWHAFYFSFPLSDPLA